MERRILLLLFTFALVCLLLPSVYGGRRHRRNRGGWNCDEEYDDDEEEHVCYKCKTRNVTKIRWYISCGGNDTCSYISYGNCCWKIKYVIEPVTRCKEVCCEGWTTDIYGRCTIRDTEAELVCENGGSKTDEGTCLCPDGFSGKTCNIATCTPACQNRGTCEGDSGVPVCVCPTGVTGNHCETPICEEDCQNGGKCLYQDYGSSYCVCLDGFEGPACQHRIKTGECPVPLNYFKCLYNSYKYEDCSYDQDCDGTKKCCFNGCDHHCLKPELPKCQHNGMSYNINETFSPDPCTRCTCLYPGKTGVQCTSVDCPNLSCEKTKYLEDACCLVCDDTGIPVGHGPVFTSCPKNVEAKVSLGTNRVDLHEFLKPRLKVSDHTGSEYKYKLSTRYINHCNCNDTRLNKHHVVATSAADKYGRFATCTVPVKVVDPYPPVLRCPTDINAFENEIIAWDKPTVRDNVGIRKLELRFGQTNNTKFVAGMYYAVYAARDYDGNEAVCFFIISIYSSETAKQYLPPQLQSEAKDGTHAAVIAGSVVGALAALCLVLLLWLCLRRCKKSKSTPRAEPAAFDNNAYVIYGAPPTYDNVYKEKLPEYVADPPVYETVEPMSEKGKAIDNPVYSVTDDAETNPDDVDVTIQQNAENDNK